MKESNFLEIFKTAAKQVLENNCVVTTKANLLYELFVNRKLEFCPATPTKPSRGNSAFQTDLCVFEKINEIEFPRVVIEFKTKVTTHDIITYSWKAGKHKSIYPSLRYGILASEINRIPNRFFIHNENIDFFIAASKYKEGMLLTFAKELILKELLVSQKLDKINFENYEFDYYRSELVLENFMK